MSSKSQAIIAASVRRGDYKIHLTNNVIPGWIRRVLREIDVLIKEKDSAGD